jgi:hypothetical protein
MLFRQYYYEIKNKKKANFILKDYFCFFISFGNNC